MKNITTLQKLIYGDRNSFFSTVTKEENIQSNNFMVMDFLLQLNEKGYRISNMEELFFLNTDNFNSFVTELENLQKELNVQGFIFRKSFADSLEQKDYTREDWVAMFAQYSVTYGNPGEKIVGKEPMEILKDYFSEVNSKTSEVKTAAREFKVDFDFNNSLEKLIINILESKIVLREQQIQILKNTPADIVYEAFKKANIIIKETEVLTISLLIGKVDLTELFMDTDQIVRVIASNFLYYKDEYSKMQHFVYEGQINNQILKHKIINLPTSVRKAIIKSLNAQKSENITVERMFKYYGFWKKILTAARWTTDVKIAEKYPTFVNIKNKLYKNNRSITLNGRVENYKKQGDYNKALIQLSSNPGLMVRNLLEYLRYTEGTKIAKKEYFTNMNDNNYEQENIASTLADILSEKMQEKELQDLLNKTTKKQTKKDIRVSKVKIDASEFLSSPGFVEALKQTNTKLLWQFLSLLKREELYENRTERNTQDTLIEYSIPLPGIDKKLTKIVKKQIKKTIFKLKQDENKTLGKVFLDKSLKNYNVQFSGRSSTSISLSGEFLSAGSKIPFSEIVGEGKLIRLGVAWKGKDSCDIDHSLNIISPKRGQSAVYYGEPVYRYNDEVIISSSGDVTSNSDEKYSVELIDIDIDKVKEAEIGNLMTSLIQYSGDTLNNYEVLWFMNIIDKKDRILSTQRVTMQIDQFQYAIQITEETRNMLGFYINFDENELEVLNMKTPNEVLNNAITNQETFMEMLNNRPPLMKMSKVLKKSIRKEQIVDNIEEASVVISDNKNLECEGVILHPGRNAEEINNIIY